MPDWIAAVPLDPFDGQSLRYDPRRRLIWSIGNDQVDVGGAIPADENGDLHVREPTARIPFE